MSEEPGGANNRINEVIARAFQEAISREHEYVTLEHILQVMLDEDDIKDILSDLQANVMLLKDDVSDWLKLHLLNVHLIELIHKQYLLAEDTWSH